MLANLTSDTPISPASARTRGGQPGNQNARKHGFYSSALTPEEQDVLEQALDLKDLLPEIALFRVKLMQLVSHPDTDPDLLLRAARALTRMVHVQHNITYR